MNYYVTKHMPLAMRLLSTGLRKTEVDAGLHGTALTEPPAFHGGCQFLFRHRGCLRGGMGPSSGRTDRGHPEIQPMWRP